MYIEVAKGFLDLANGLWSTTSKILVERRHKRKRVSDFLMKISDCLKGMASGAEQNIPVDELSGELGAYMDGLMSALEGIAKKSILEEYSKILNEAAIRIKLVAELNDPKQRDEAIRLLRQAAGRFRGLANSLRV
jgi:hypothetical protein